MSEADLQSARSGEVVPLATFGRALRYRWPLVLLATLLGVALGLLITNLREPAFSAATTVQINRGLVGGDVLESNATSGVNAVSEGQFARSTAVAEAAKRLLATDQDTDELLGQVEVQASEPAASLTFRFSENSERGAVEGANAFADAYLEVRAAQLTALLERTRTALQEQQDRVATELLRPGAPVVALQAQLTDSAQRLGRLASVVVDPGRTVSRASQAQQGLSPIVFLIAGGLIGFLLGWVGAVLLEGRRGVVRTEEDLRLLSVPVLGAWSSSTRDQASVAARLALQLRARSSGTVVVSEPPAGQEISPELGRALVDCGLRTAVVAGQEGPVLNVGRRSSDLTTSGAGRRGRPVLRKSDRRPPLTLGPVGSRPRPRPTPDAGAARESSSSAVAVAPQTPATETAPAAPNAAAVPGVDITLVSVPSLLVSSVGLLPAADAGGLVLVCGRGSTRLVDLAELLPDLQRAGVQVLGVVLL
jgi:hypothetical protein